MPRTPPSWTLDECMRVCVCLCARVAVQMNSRTRKEKNARRQVIILLLTRDLRANPTVVLQLLLEQPPQRRHNYVIPRYRVNVSQQTVGSFLGEEAFQLICCSLASPVKRMLSLTKSRCELSNSRHARRRVLFSRGRDERMKSVDTKHCCRGKTFAPSIQYLSLRIVRRGQAASPAAQKLAKD